MGNASVEYVVRLTPIYRIQAHRRHLIDDFRGWKDNTSCVYNNRIFSYNDPENTTAGYAEPNDRHAVVARPYSRSRAVAGYAATRRIPAHPSQRERQL